MGLIRPLGLISPISLISPVHGPAARTLRRRGVARHGVAPGIVRADFGRQIGKPLGVALHQQFDVAPLHDVGEQFLAMLGGHLAFAFDAAECFLELRVGRIETVERRLLVAVPVIGQVDIHQTLSREARGLSGGVETDLLAKDDAGNAPILAGGLAVGPEHDPPKQVLVSLHQRLQLGGGGLELFGGLVPGRPIGANGGDPLEPGLRFRGGRNGINGAGAPDARGVGLVDVVVHGATSEWIACSFDKTCVAVHNSRRVRCPGVSSRMEFCAK